VSIRRKILGLLLATFVVLLVSQYLVQRLVVLPSFQALERDDAERNLDRVLRALDNEVNHLDALAHDWAAWDDTVGLVGGTNPGFEDSNLTLDAFKTNRLSLAQFVANDGAPVGPPLDLCAGGKMS